MENFEANRFRKKPPFERILETIDNDYYTFLNNLEELEEKTGKNNPLLKELFGDTEKIKFLIDQKITGSIEKINLLMKERGIEISYDNSLIDILNNSIITGIRTANKIINSIADGREVNLSETKKRLLDLLKKSFVDVPYYLDKICAEPEKFESELVSREGYLKKFEKYFNKNREGQTMFPAGGRKIDYIRMFDEVTPENAEKMIEGPYIDKNILNVRKVIDDVRQGRLKNTTE